MSWLTTASMGRTQGKGEKPTVLLRVDCGRVGRGDHLAGLSSQLDQDGMDFG